MKHSVPKRRDPYAMLEKALEDGWQTVDTIPLKGEGQFLVMTLSGLIKLSHNRRHYRRFKDADGYGPMRISVNAVVSGNYLAAIAWKRAP